ncbi:hypothetical protein CPC08DRAFT_715596 [Agrocybe pediades]|nr:hypothetical protein CPC08DRAFT_715596 [Agrocybe pediades]
MSTESVEYWSIFTRLKADVRAGEGWRTQNVDAGYFVERGRISDLPFEARNVSIC